MRSKVFFAFVLSLIASCLSLHAQTVSPEAARAKAMDFFSTGAKNLPARKGAMRKAPAVSNVELAYTSEKGGKTCFYVYNNGTDGGFVIVGGDEVAQEILAYSDHGHFDYDKAPDNFKDMLSQYTEQISLAKPVAKSLPAKSPAKVAAATTVQKEDIPDLIETTWNQLDPYNRAIPKLVNSNTGEQFTPPTGCVHTATAQVMKYWNYPEHGTGCISRTIDYSQEDPYSIGSGGSAPEFGAITHNIDYQNSYYDWDNMLNNYSGEETEEQIRAVSTLMYHVGVACYGIYGINETTGANPEEGLKKYFGYSPKAKEICRDEFDDQTWEEIIYSELALKRPVIYFGVGEGFVGHEYIIHGYSSEYDMYKVNWGWGGFMDCYCKLTGTAGSTFLGYDYHQTAVVRLQPATMDSDSSVDIGDTFWSGGLKYSVISKVFNTIDVIRPDKGEPWYANPHVTVPATVSYNGVLYSVIGTGKYAFSTRLLDGEIDDSATPINKIDLPEKLRRIGARAFTDSELETISIPNNVTFLAEACFDCCVSLESIALPSSLKNISSGCFNVCRSLKRVIVPDNVSAIENYAFYRCTNLSYVELPSSLELLDGFAFSESNNLDVLICKAVTPPTTSGWGDPFSRSALVGTLIVPGESIEKYQKSQYWKDWKNIIAIESVDVSSLRNTCIQNDVEYTIKPNSVEVSKVNGTQSTITIPDNITVNNREINVTSIGSKSFYGKTYDTVILPQHLTAIKPYAFYSSFIKQLTIPNSVTEIGEFAFSSCSGMGSMIFPNSIKEIPWYCCSYSSFKLALIPENVSIIRSLAFRDCSRLKTVVLPSTLEMMEWGIFGGCNSLDTLICLSATPPVLEYPTLEVLFPDRIGSGYLFVPAESIDKYLSSPYWKDWGNILPIIPLSEINIDGDSHDLRIGSKQSLLTLPSPINATATHCTWSSSNPTIASVDQNGVVTAHKSGTVTITATSMYYPDVTATCTVTVKAGTVGTLVDAIDGLPSSRTTLQDVDDAVDSILER